MFNEIFSFLHKYCSVPSSLCDFCFMTRDSLSHMFWECHIIQAFWRNVTVFLQNKLSINTELSYKKISFCNDSYPNVNGKDKSVSINFILFLAKYFIFKCKNRKETPCMFQFEISISEPDVLTILLSFYLSSPGVIFKYVIEEKAVYVINIHGKTVQ